MIRQILQKIGNLWYRTPWQVLLLLFAAPFLIRNLLLPMVGDDFSYAFIWDGEHGGNLMDDIGPRERIDSFHDILVSQWSHYMTWGGRTFSMLFIQFFAWVGKGWFDVANTAVFIVLMLVLYWLAIGRIASPAHHKGTFLWVMLCMHFGVLDYPSTMLWMTGACVYLWTGLWECLFLLPFVVSTFHIPHSKFHMTHPTPVMAFLGLWAGWSEEAGSLVTVALTTFFLYMAWRQKRLKRWMVVGFVLLLVGCCMLMLCPGSIHREQLMLELAPEYVLPADKLFSAEMFWVNFTEGFLPILIWESFLLIPIALYYLNRKKFKPQHSAPCTQLISVFSIGGILVLVAMMFAPEFALRTGFHSTLFLTVASAAAFKQIVPWLKQVLTATTLRRLASFSVGTLCVLYGLFVMVGAFYIESSYRRQFDDRLDYVLQHKDEELLVVPAFRIPADLDAYVGPRSLIEEHLIYAADVESKTTDNRSLMYARYYDLPPICIDRQVDWNKRNGE